MYLNFNKYPELLMLFPKKRKELIREWFLKDKKSKMIHLLIMVVFIVPLISLAKPIAILITGSVSSFDVAFISGCLAMVAYMIVQPFVATYVLRNRFVKYLKELQPQM
ncbi:MAG: hypothetical protein O7D86_13485 [Proteobacteria bacterium]|nr:hypothetical protein [Pseudomonadota bacterium]